MKRPDLAPWRCLDALTQIDALRTHARTDAVDLVERIAAICDEALAITAGSRRAKTRSRLGAQASQSGHRPNSIEVSP
jgi:hypothetical protein